MSVFGDIGTWVGGIGSAAAAVVAVRIAMVDRRVRKYERESRERILCAQIGPEMKSLLPAIASLASDVDDVVQKCHPLGPQIVSKLAFLAGTHLTVVIDACEKHLTDIEPSLGSNLAVGLACYRSGIAELARGPKVYAEFVVPEEFRTRLIAARDYLNAAHTYLAPAYSVIVTKAGVIGFDKVP